ncbi:hypothetical protein [Paracoccus luteus]|uniref:hypothetical protein n=1 Tax=Paracoccus luteus TaxID=2508543 RepID=UPI00106F705F|nr:hypothetical protein [Paracoccus luteus]
MRLTVLPVLAAALALSGCVVAVPPGAQVATPPVVVTPPVTVTPARPDNVAARQVVNAEMAKRLPGRNVAPLTDCVVSNATMAEMADLAAMQGTTGAADAVASIVKRPAVSQCIARAAVA